MLCARRDLNRPILGGVRPYDPSSSSSRAQNLTSDADLAIAKVKAMRTGMLQRRASMREVHECAKDVVAECGEVGLPCG